MRSSSSLVVFLCLFTFSILGFGAKPPAAKKGANVKAEAEHETTETTKPTVLKNEVDLDRPVDTSELKTGEFFLKTIEVDGRKVERAYFKDGATGKEYWIRACDEGTDESKKCIAEIRKCKAGDKCEIRAEIFGDSIIAKSLKVLPEEKVTKTGHKFRLVSEDELTKLLGDKTHAKKCGEAYEAPNKVVWCDAAKKADGTLEYMKYDAAVEYCKKMGAELPTGWREDQNGKNNFPNKDSDFVQLRKYLGAKVGTIGYDIPEGYTPQILPNLSNWFRSSSVHPGNSSNACEFNGRSGGISNGFSRDYSYVAARCVVRR